MADRQFVTDLTLAMVQNKEPSAVVSVAIKKLARHLGAERVGISELNADGKTLLTRAVWSDNSLPAAPPVSAIRSRSGRYRAVSFGRRRPPTRPTPFAPPTCLSVLVGSASGEQLQSSTKRYGSRCTSPGATCSTNHSPPTATPTTSSSAGTC